MSSSELFYVIHNQHQSSGAWSRCYLCVVRPALLAVLSTERTGRAGAVLLLSLENDQLLYLCFTALRIDTTLSQVYFVVVPVVVVVAVPLERSKLSSPPPPS